MAGVDAQIAEARKAGYSDAEIMSYLGGQPNVKTGITQARNAGYTDDEILQHLSGGVAGPAPAPPKPKLDPADVPSVAETLLIGAGRTFDRIGKGAQQVWYAARGDQAALANLKQSAGDDDVQYNKLVDARPIATAVGESLPSMVVPVGGTANVLATAGKLALGAAVPAALEYGTPEERAKRAALAAAGGVVGGVVVPKAVGLAVGGAKALASKVMGDVTPEVAALAAKANALGIPVSAAQLSDSKLAKTLASATENLPFSGATKTFDSQRRDFTRAVAKTFGADTDTITSDVYKSARDRLGSQFDELSARNNLNVDPALLHNIGNVSEEATKYASNDSTKAVKNAIDELMSKMDPATGTIPGQAYQSLDSKLAALTKSGGETSIYLGKLRTAVQEAMDRSITPEDQALWQTTRAQYRNLKAIRDLVAKDGATGEISPAGLMARLTNNEASKNSMAAGTRGDLGDIGKIGAQFIKDKIPNSGTAQRLMAQSALTTGLVGSGYLAGMDPKTLGMLSVAGMTSGRIANRVLNSPAGGQAMLNRGAQKLSDLFMATPGKTSQIIGGGTGMTIADLLGR